jgi:putative flippase GtrA
LQILLYLNAHLTVDTYYNQIVAMVFYTAFNFLLNKYFTFKKQQE